jgi:asparagine synthase (glutamine-hydrolysing)
MCGIGGYFLRSGVRVANDILDKMEQALAHRGPDGTGHFVEGPVGFVHKRLSIIDLADGAQPFVQRTDGGAKTLMANGEIYNHSELRRELAANFDFGSQSDCETLFAIWAEHGVKILSRLRGMYAAAMYDSARDEGVLVRDPFGIKPLYYCEDERGVFFASEPAALRAAGIGSGAPDRLHAACIIDRQFAPDHVTPFTTIKRVGPGETLVIKAGKIASRHHDRPLDATTSFGNAAKTLDDGSGDASTATFAKHLHNSVSAHLMSDVPLGLFFSGGVDSSAILASMAALRAKGEAAQGEPLLTYTVRFDRGGNDETAQASALAAAAGAEFVDVPYGKADFWRDAGLAALACDDAVADYAILPTLHLAARAARDVKVILSGEGGDEFFAGYGRYRAGMRVLAPKFPTRPGAALRGKILPADTDRQLRDLYRQSAARMPSFWQRARGRDGALACLQRHDIDDWLPNDLLIKLDRCLMRHGIEGRTPFVDRQISVYGYGLPARAKIGAAGGKLLVKRWLDDVMPECAPFAKKRGFTVPVGAWISEEAGMLTPLVAAQPGIAGLLRGDDISAIFHAANGRSGLLAWRILFYALWHQIHCCGVAADQPLADILAA